MERQSRLRLSTSGLNAARRVELCPFNLSKRVSVHSGTVYSTKGL